VFGLEGIKMRFSGHGAPAIWEWSNRMAQGAVSCRLEEVGRGVSRKCRGLGCRDSKLATSSNTTRDSATGPARLL
jgi:hypothetical protein